ncbi:MAG: peptidoglycan DD-metalloendopeptidase family protein [Gemmatimonadota bacterium]
MQLDSRAVPAALLATLFLLSGCGPVRDEVADIFRGETARENYEHALVSAGLEGTALVTAWRAAGARALAEAAPLEAPFAEEGWLPAEGAEAVGVRLAVRRGQRLEIRGSLRPDSGALLFIDVFRVAGDGPRRVASADSGATSLDYEPSRDGDYIVRLQPELLAGGRYTLQVITAAALAFPVDGHGTGAIQSVFGDPRDGGVRDHHGVDIFAPRGTPALAASAGTVSRVQDTSRGGLVVWIRDERRGANLYYAHLDAQTVERGQRVEVGDTVGLIGNTGNARTTPPHLHFGVYSRGPTDPAPWIRPLARTPPALRGDTALLGGWARVSAAGAEVRAGPADGAAVLERLGRSVPLRVLGAAGSWYRVRLADGRSGYMRADRAESALEPLSHQRMAAATAIHHAPGPAGLRVAELAAGTQVEVLGEYQGYTLVRAPLAPLGWLPPTTVDTD